MAVQAAIQIVLGHNQSDDPAPGKGQFRQRDELRKLFPDQGRVYISVVTADYSTEECADRILALDPEIIVYDGYSWGIGRAWPKFLKRMQERGRKIDLLVAKDPVPRTQLKLEGWQLWAHRTMTAVGLINRDNPIVVPADAVREVLAFRTLNQPSAAHPWGRGIEHPSVMRVTFGRDLPEARTAELTLINDPKVIHSTIDDNDYVIARTCEEVRRLVPDLAEA